MGIIMIYELTFTSLGNHHLVGSNGPWGPWGPWGPGAVQVVLGNSLKATCKDEECPGRETSIRKPFFLHGKCFSKWHMEQDVNIYIYMYDMIWYDVIWCDMMWYDVIWCDMIWCDMIWCDMYMIWCDVILCDMLWNDLTWYVLYIYICWWLYYVYIYIYMFLL